MSDERYLTQKEASQFLAELGLHIAPSTLSKLRCVGGGPVFQSFGRFPRYTPTRLREFALSKLSGERSSTTSQAPRVRSRGRPRVIALREDAPPAARAAAPSGGST